METTEKVMSDIKNSFHSVLKEILFDALIGKIDTNVKQV